MQRSSRKHVVMLVLIPHTMQWIGMLPYPSVHPVVLTGCLHIAVSVLSRMVRPGQPASLAHSMPLPASSSRRSAPLKHARWVGRWQQWQ